MANPQMMEASMGPSIPQHQAELMAMLGHKQAMPAPRSPEFGQMALENPAIVPPRGSVEYLDFAQFNPQVLDALRQNSQPGQPAQPPAQPAAAPQGGNRSPMMNFFEILMGSSPLQQSGMGAGR